MVVGGVAGGIAGALGAAAVVVGGALAGVTQIVRGVAATPEALTAPRQGKWWNENEGKWVKTDMNEEKKSLDNVPEDDSDILGKAKQEVDQSAQNSNGTVADMFYYDTLELPADAEPSAIKRKYYLMARKYHPDKNPGDEEAATKFKDIAAAYQVLSDPELRAKYDRDGREGLSATQDSIDEPQLDPTLLFAFLFGSDKFSDYTGPLATATSASIGDANKVSLQDARALQKRRVVRLAVKLVDKIQPFVERCKQGAGKDDTDDVEQVWAAEAIELSQASFGYELLQTLGKIYQMFAAMYEGSIESGQGLPKLSEWAAAQRAEMDKKKAANKTQMETFKAGLDMMKLKMEMDEKLKMCESDDKRAEVQREMEEKAQVIMVRIFWTTTVVDITSTLNEVCKVVFHDQAVDKEERMFRCTAVKKLGGIWLATPEPEGREDSAKRLYEEAAFAAMVETAKRKDGA